MKPASLSSKKIAHLDVHTWDGLAPDAHHYLGTLECSDQKFELTTLVSVKEATRKNKECREQYGSAPYKAGEETKKFESYEDLVKSAISKCKEIFPEAKIILEGTRSSLSVRKAIHGPKLIVAKINKLHKEALALNYYSGRNDEMRL